LNLRSSCEWKDHRPQSISDAISSADEIQVRENTQGSATNKMPHPLISRAISSQGPDEDFQITDLEGHQNHPVMPTTALR
jgi:hypothetical protein